MREGWFVRRNGEEKGPFSSATLKQLADAGKLRPQDEVRKEGRADYVPAIAVRGLFSNASADRASQQGNRSIATTVKTPATPIAGRQKSQSQGAESPEREGLAQPLSRFAKRFFGVILALVVVASVAAMLGRIRQRIRESARLSPEEVRALEAHDAKLRASDARRKEARDAAAQAAAAQAAAAQAAEAQAAEAQAAEAQAAEAQAVEARIRAVEIAGLRLGMNEEELLKAFHGIPVAYIDMDLCPRYAAFISPSDRTNALKLFTHDFVKDWTDADFSRYQRGHERLLASLPAWMGDPRSPSIANRYASQTDWNRFWDGPAPAWKYIVFAGGPAGTQQVNFTEVKYHETHGVIALFIEYQEGVSFDQLMTAMKKKFGESQAYLQEERGRITERVSRDTYVHKDNALINVRAGQPKWEPVKGATIQLSSPGDSRPDVTLVRADVLEQIEKAEWGAYCERQSKREEQSSSQLGL